LSHHMGEVPKSRTQTTTESRSLIFSGRGVRGQDARGREREGKALRKKMLLAGREGHSFTPSCRPDTRAGCRSDAERGFRRPGREGVCFLRGFGHQRPQKLVSGLAGNRGVEGSLVGVWEQKTKNHLARARRGRPSFEDGNPLKRAILGGSSSCSTQWRWVKGGRLERGGLS